MPGDNTTDTYPSGEDSKTRDDPLTNRVTHDLFSNTYGTLEDHIAQKAALAHPTRYAIAYYLWDHTATTHSHLTDITTTADDELNTHLDELITAGLVKRSHSYHTTSRDNPTYHLTHIGKQILRSDHKHIVGVDADNTDGDTTNGGDGEDWTTGDVPSDAEDTGTAD